ncbi:MAG: hypothetical protein KDI88_14455 [Gammaproteobacteria bacterium]|nr:hypothetical protein [Gammaproteobacteria bacterium]
MASTSLFRNAATRIGIAVAVTLALLAVEPALANKFETIGSGVSGSVAIKREWLKLFFYIAAGVCALGAALAVIVPHRNPLYLNHRNWKVSSAVMALFAVVFVTTGIVI